MNVLIWLACAAGCALLWLLQELVGSMVGEAVGMLLDWMFSPFSRVLRRLLGGAHGVAWRRILTAAGVAALAGGMLLFFDGANRAAGAECIAGFAAAAVAIVGLLSLDAHLQDARIAARRKVRG